MSNKMVCLGCDSYTSTVYDAYEVGSPCPVCGLSADATYAVREAQKRRADEELTAKYLEAEKRAGKAEKEAAVLRYRLDEVERSVAAALKVELPPW